MKNVKAISNPSDGKWFERAFRYSFALSRAFIYLFFSSKRKKTQVLKEKKESKFWEEEEEKKRTFSALNFQRKRERERERKKRKRKNSIEDLW